MDGISHQYHSYRFLSLYVCAWIYPFLGNDSEQDFRYHRGWTNSSQKSIDLVQRN